MNHLIDLRADELSRLADLEESCAVLASALERLGR
jgi:hypothetical protein